MRLEIFTLCVLMLLHSVRSQQNSCESDEDCSEGAPCCSQFGFCGSGEGFCTDVDDRRIGGGADTAISGGTNRPRVVNRSGSGCTENDVEYIGGDLLPLEGGGGVDINDRRSGSGAVRSYNSSRECFLRCEENFRCKYFTYDEREGLCYLKRLRGYARKRRDGFVSGSTDRDGCDDPECRPPYAYYSYQCMYFYEPSVKYGISLADVRRNFNNSKEVCKETGGFLPYDFQESAFGAYGNDWHWVGYPGQGDQCYAGIPSQWSRGVRSFPCDSNLNFACEREGLYPVPVPPRPQIYRDVVPQTVVRNVRPSIVRNVRPSITRTIPSSQRRLYRVRVPVRRYYIRRRLF